MTTSSKTNSISLLWQQLGVSPAQADLWQELAHLYAKRSLPWQAGYAARQAVRCDKSMATKLKALKIGD